jgi:hypothetical protein
MKIDAKIKKNEMIKKKQKILEVSEDEHEQSHSKVKLGIDEINMAEGLMRRSSSSYVEMNQNMTKRMKDD